jgi:hypothetical protein
VGQVRVHCGQSNQRESLNYRVHTNPNARIKSVDEGDFELAAPMAVAAWGDGDR